MIYILDRPPENTTGFRPSPKHFFATSVPKVHDSILNACSLTILVNGSAQ